MGHDALAWGEKDELTRQLNPDRSNNEPGSFFFGTGLCQASHPLTGNWLDVLIIEGSIPRGIRWVIYIFTV